MRLLMYIFLPFGALFSLWQNLIKRIFKSKDDRKMSQEELLTFVDEVQQDGSIDHNESQLLRNAIEFTDLRAEDILTHRVNLEAIPVDTEKEKIAEIFYESKYSRLLVYDEDIDHIVGVLHQKDLYHGAHVTELPLSEIITTPIFVVKDVKISEMIRLLQASKSHVAVVVDEYGGTHGIVTMEDILEELVGEIYDEHDEVPEDMTEIDEDTDVVDGSMDLSDFIDHYGLEIESDAISLNGWIVELIEKIPDVGDTVTYENYEITVTEVESHCASKLRVHKLADLAEEDMG
jgi:CBS domain containing-hemolysin-like protein